ncbi:MAG: hypothetical protein MUF08_00505 [Burkholderiaceae bacterium]|jgi:hypothetical protein|nr:hypothetical protein [Burkholderiaceae bacterium]
MPITVAAGPTMPAITYNEVHVNELRIVISEEQNSKAHVRLVYKLLGRDGEAQKHYDKAQHVVVIEDAFAEAEVKAAEGNFALAQALVGIEVAIAAILTEQGSHGAVARAG